MLGMNRLTGKPLTGREHVVQSIMDILTTAVGSRVMLRDYGSRVPDLVDRPANELLEVELQAETAGALERWEPRFKLSTVWIEGRNPLGRVTIGIEGTLVSDGSVMRIEGIVL